MGLLPVCRGWELVLEEGMSQYLSCSFKPNNLEHPQSSSLSGLFLELLFGNLLDPFI